MPILFIKEKDWEEIPVVSGINQVSSRQVSSSGTTSAYAV